MATSLFAQNESKLTDEQIIKLYEGLRVADVSDGMDMIRMMNVGLVDQSIAPLWRDSENFEHQFTGIALTVKYIPSHRPEIARFRFSKYFQFPTNGLCILSMRQS